jgi:transcriptional regulator with XRE-family HTH domain
MKFTSPIAVDLRLASTSEVVEALGKRLREQRLSKVMTQAELSGRAGVALGAVKKLESSGKVTVETLVLVARALGLIDELRDLFSIRVQTSIADMERGELAKRQRARKPSDKSA